MASVYQDTALGQFFRFASRGRFFKHPEDRDDFRLPEAWQRMLEDDEANPAPSSDSTSPASSAASRTGSLTDEEKATRPDASPYASPGDIATAIRAESHPTISRTKSREETSPYTKERLEADEIHHVQRIHSIPIVPKRTKEGAILVDWYASDDSANPQNWGNGRRVGVAAVICLYTFVVYASSAIFVTSEYGVMAEFGVNGYQASLGLALFVLGYGTGPLLFSPLSEIPSLGRNPIYMITMFLFVIVSIPAPFITNYEGLMVLRFLQGFFGSPCLASGAATLGDLYSLLNLPYALIAWVSFAYCGPALGPLLSGFAVPVLGWRISLFEILWAGSPAFVMMFLWLPETSAPNILLRRAHRLNARFNTTRFVSKDELNNRNVKASALIIDALIKPIEITVKDPAILFVQVYTGIIYGIYYSFFEVFPLVYPTYYNMNMGQIGLVFLCLLIACLLGIASYASYLALYLNPRIVKFGFPAPEARLVPALFASFGPTIGLFIFAWTARPDVHWIAPTIGITIYGAAGFVLMQCIFVYVPLSYPQYAASLFAGNDFFRSASAFASILYAKPLFGNLGVARGVSLLGGLSTIGIFGIWILYYTGARLRAMSKFAISE